MKQRTGIIGITGYTGFELLRLVDAHPSLELTLGVAGASAGSELTESWPGLNGLLDLSVEELDAKVIAERCDVVFLALPHGHAAGLAPGLVEAGVRVVDLGADFRLRNPEVYARHYGLTHPHPEWLDRAVYGLPELDRSRLPGARLIAAPGCYVTAVTLATLPLLKGDWVDGPLVASCLSGVSGAGRKPGARSLFCEVGESSQPYGLAGTHRHTPEIEQNLGAPISFTPHLVPMNRGILATVSAPTHGGANQEKLQAAYQETYGSEPMVVLRDSPPSTADVRGSNRAHLHVAYDAERNMTTVVCAIDNLLKGAAGQGVQALNAALGLPETTGLPLYPSPI